MAVHLPCRFLEIPDINDTPFIVVDCGARGGSDESQILAAFPQAQVIGFEPDAAECLQLNRNAESLGAAKRWVFYPAAVGATEAECCFYVTANPACSSLYVPNSSFFGEFLNCGDQIRVTAEVTLNTVPLDTYLPSVGISQIHFLKLDVQGAELDILRGAKHFLKTSVLGVKAEVSFAPIYCQQPLFGEVDEYLRAQGFMLFDLSRTYYRRGLMMPDLPTRGQLLWGDAIYLRDYTHLLEHSQVFSCLQLAILASTQGFHDYSLQILERVQDTLPEGDVRKLVLLQSKHEYIKIMQQPDRAQRLYRRLTAPRWLRPLFDRLFPMVNRLLQVRCHETEQRHSYWVD